MNKNIGSTKSDKLRPQEEKKAIPVFVKYGLIAVAIIAVIVIGLLIYLNVAGSYVATVDGEKIGTGEFKYYLEMQKQSMLAIAQKEDPKVTADTFWSTKIGGEDAKEVAKKQALDTAKETKIQYIKAKEAKVSLTKDEISSSIDTNIQNVINQMDPSKPTTGNGSKMRANKEFVKLYGFSIDELRNAMLEIYTVQKYQSQEINKITDNEANVDNNYSKHPDWYKEDTQMRTGAEEALWARHILIQVAQDASQADKDAAKKKAEDLIVKLKNGEDFSKLAKENSADGSAERGGDYLFGKGQMVKEFEDAAFALSPGQFTETPVQTQFGYHIIKLEEKYAKDQPVSLKCAKEYYEYGLQFVKYKLYKEKVKGWDNEPQYQPKVNTKVYSSIKW